MFFKERAAASKRYQEKCATPSEKNICAAVFEHIFYVEENVRLLLRELCSLIFQEIKLLRNF